MTTTPLTLVQAVDEAFDGCNDTLKANIVKYVSETLSNFSIGAWLALSNGFVPSSEVLQELLEDMVYDDNYNLSELSEWVPERFLGIEEEEGDEFEWMNIEDMNKTSTTLTRMSDQKEVDIVEAWWKL